MLWMGMGGHRSMLMVMVWVWAQIRRKMLGSDVKVYVDSYIASNGSCFMVTWIVFENHLLEVGLTQNHWETMAF